MANPTPVSTKCREGDGGVTLGGVVGSSGFWASERNGSTHGVPRRLAADNDAPSTMTFDLAQPTVEHTHCRRAGIQGSLFRAMVDVDRPLRDRAEVLGKVLRIGRVAFRHSTHPMRSNSEFPYGSSLVVKGDALIHGPRLVAQPVGSEWRIHRLYQASSQSN